MKFCGSCGRPLPERRTSGASERKVVTALFCDVKGSTALAEKMDPEEWTEVIDGAFKVLTPPIFDHEPVADLEVKGREARTEAFRVRGVGAAVRGRLRAAAAPLIGRDREMAALRDALAEVRRGGGRIVSIVGDAGLGKTRLIDELGGERESRPVEGQRWTEARGQS